MSHVRRWPFSKACRVSCALGSVLWPVVTAGCDPSSLPGASGAGAPTAPDRPAPPIVGAVGVNNSSFTPDIVNLEVGGSVTWTNFGPSRHSTVSTVGLWDSGRLLPPDLPGDPSVEGDSPAGESFTRIFTESGIFPFYCDLHPDKRGTVYVSLESIPGGGPGK